MVASVLFTPRSPAELVARWPTETEWKAELESGWPGSNGSSASLDNIEGIRIGSTTTAYTPDLPANLHDFHYRVLRRLRLVLSRKTRRAMRRAADAEHLEGLLRDVAILVGWNGWKARQRARVRWVVLRLFGWRAIWRKSDEGYPD